MDFRRKAHRLESQQKILLLIGSQAEDTLKTFLSHSETSDRAWLSDSLSKSWAESVHVGSGSEDSVVSGPSSPCAGLRPLRCSMCERLFSKMTKQGPRRKKRQDDDPASLSCDEWLLNKTWRPQRHRRSRGQLWVHLRNIRLRALKQLEDGIENTASSFCSRPHVFLQRNLRRCKTTSRKPSKSKSRPLHQRRKRKSSENADTSEQLLPLDLSSTSEIKSHVRDGVRHEESRSEKVPKMQRVHDVSSSVDTQTQGGQRTRRVLKFDTVPHLEDRSEDLMSGDGLSYLDDLDDVFRTPPELHAVDLTATAKSRQSRPFGARKDSFRAMLASLVHGQNQIVKETH